MRVMKYIAILFALVAGLLACEEEFSPNIPQGRMEEVSFAKDTFMFSEAAGTVQVPIVATKYLNYGSTITVKVTDGTAVEKEHFYMDVKEVKMELGKAEIDLDLRIIDDTIINPNRTFQIEIVSIQGGGKPAATKQSCVVILRNDDFIPEAAVVFDNPTASVREDALALTVPFHIVTTKPVPGDVTITFAQGTDDRQTAKEGIHFNFLDNVKSITLPEGTLKGEVKLEIIDNLTADGNVYFDLAIRQAAGVLIGQDSICKVTIEDDDLDRTVRFGGPENDTLWYEEAGTIEIPLIFEGGNSAERMISGKIIVDSVYGCVNGVDFKLETTEFSTAGNETVKLKATLKDNETFGDWGFRIAFRDLKNVRAMTKDFVVRVKDDERILGFQEATVEVNEGESISIATLLKGGDASSHLPIKIEVVSDQTTAVAEQYTLPSTFSSIYQGTNSSAFNLRTFQHNSREDKVLTLKVTTTAGTTSPNKILLDGSEICKVTIKNTDKYIGFLNNECNTATLGVYSLPLASSAFEENAIVYFEVEQSSLAAGDYELLDKNILIKAGAQSGNVRLKLKKGLESGQSVTVKITKVVFDSGEDNSQLNPDKLSCTCKPLNLKDIPTERLDRTGWEVVYFSSEEAEGEGDSGRAVDIIDNNPDTYWHSEWYNNAAQNPHTLIFDLHSYVAISGADITRRLGNTDTKKAIFELSSDQETWIPIGTVDTFTGNDGSVRTTKIVYGRYLRLTASGRDDGSTNIAEIYLTGEKWY